MGVILLCPARPDKAVRRESSESWASLSTFLTQGLCSEMATQASARPSPITFWPLGSTRSLSEETVARSRGRALQPRRVPHGIERVARFPASRGLSGPLAVLHHLVTLEGCRGDELLRTEVRFRSVRPAEPPRAWWAPLFVPRGQKLMCYFVL